MRKDWEVYCIKDLGKVVTGSTPSTKNELNYSSNDYSFVKPSDISQNQISYIDETECYVSEYAFQNSRILPSGTVLVTCIGIIGKVGITKNDCICNQQINAIIPNDKVNNKFLAYSVFSKKEVLSLIANAPVVPIINKNDFSNIKLSIPPLQTQHQIVEELDSLTSIIEKQKKQLEELDNLAQSIFYDMFGSIHNNKESLDINNLNDLCEFIKDGTHNTPQYTEDKVNGVKFLSAKDVVEGCINWENIKYIPYELHEELHKRIAPQRDDILLCKNGTTGIAAIVDTDDVFDIYVSLALLRFKKPYNAIYMLYAINNPYTKEQFNSSLKGVGVPNLHLGEIKKAKILCPPLSLQQEFASKIEAIEKQKEIIKKSIKETEDLFNSRMDYYFN